MSIVLLFPLLKYLTFHISISYKNTWFVSTKPLSNTSILFLRLYSWKLKWSWFILLATTTFSRSVDHSVCNNLQKKKWKIWCFFEITCHIPVLLSSETREAGLLVVQCGEGLTYYWIGDGTSSNMAVKMYGVFQSRYQGPLSSSLARVLMENWIFSEVLELHAPQNLKLWRIKFVDL